MVLKLVDTDLSVIEGQVPDQLQVGQGRHIIGRGTKADVQLSAQKDGKFIISRSHAALEVNADGTVSIEDLGSLNGVFVNQVRITVSALQDNDVVQFGGMSDIPVGAKLQHSDIAVRYQLKFHSQKSPKDEKKTQGKVSASIKKEATNNSAAKDSSVVEKESNTSSNNLNKVFEDISTNASYKSNDNGNKGSGKRAREDSLLLNAHSSGGKTSPVLPVTNKKMRAPTPNTVEPSADIQIIRKFNDDFRYEINSIKDDHKRDFENLVQKLDGMYKLLNGLVERGVQGRYESSSPSADRQMRTKKSVTDSITISNSNESTSSSSKLVSRSPFQNQNYCQIDINTLKAQVQCFLCKQVILDVAVLSCSHSFCQCCIEQHFKKGKYSCPMCGTMFEKNMKHRYNRCDQLDSIIWLVLEASSADERKVSITIFITRLSSANVQ